MPLCVPRIDRFKTPLPPCTYTQWPPHHPCQTGGLGEGESGWLSLASGSISLRQIPSRDLGPARSVVRRPAGTQLGGPRRGVGGRWKGVMGGCSSSVCGRPVSPWAPCRLCPVPPLPPSLPPFPPPWEGRRAQTGELGRREGTPEWGLLPRAPKTLPPFTSPVPCWRPGLRATPCPGLGIARCPCRGCACRCACTRVIHADACVLGWGRLSLRESSSRGSFHAKRRR